MTAINSELLKLKELSYTNIKSVQYLVSVINKSKEAISSLEYIFPNVYYVYIILKGLGTPFGSLIKDIRQRKTADITLEDYVTQAFTEEISVKRNDLSTQQHTASAIKTGYIKEQKHKGQKALQSKQASAR
jgi:hypothetical protein